MQAHTDKPFCPGSIRRPCSLPLPAPDCSLVSGGEAHVSSKLWVIARLLQLGDNLLTVTNKAMSAILGQPPGLKRKHMPTVDELKSVSYRFIVGWTPYTNKDKKKKKEEKFKNNNIPSLKSETNEI